MSGRRLYGALAARAAALPLALSLVAGGAAAQGVVRVSESQVRALGVETTTPRPQAGGEISGLPARVIVPNQQLRVVSTPLAGLVRELLVVPPSEVRRGQPLVRLESPELAQLQQTYLQAATRLKLARTQLDRDEKLLAEGIAAESRVQATRARWIEVSADFSERTQMLRLAGMSDASIAELRTGQRVGTTTVLAAPIDGVVLEQLAVVGQRVEAATPLLKIGRLDPLWLEVQVPAARVAELRIGASVGVRAQDAAGTVIAIGRNVNPANQTVTVRAVTTRGARRLLPGQSVEATVGTSPERGDWNVPNSALAREAGTTSVFVRSADGFRRTPVTLVSEGPEHSVIAGPLRPGDRIAFKGVAALKAVEAAAKGE